MAIFYERKAKQAFRGGGQQDATKFYLEHYGKSLVLTWMQRSSSDREVRQMATEELDIAERKMRFWEGREGFNVNAAIKGIDLLKKQMQSSVGVS